MIGGVSYDIDVDLLSGKYGGDGGAVSKHVDGIKALPATGGNFAFEFPPENVKIDYTRPDGALDIGHVRVISIVPYIVMKAAALGRGKPKDAMIFITASITTRVASECFCKKCYLIKTKV